VESERRERTPEGYGEREIDGASVHRWVTALARSSGAAIVTADLSGTVTGWNRGAQCTYGYRCDEMLGQSVALLEPPNRSGETQELLRRVSGGEAMRSFETTWIGKDGGRSNVSLNIAPVVNDDGDVTGTITIAHDLTVQYETARRTEDRFRALVQNSGDLIVVVDDAAELLYANPSAQVLLGFDPERWRGRSLLHLIHPDDADPVATALGRTMEPSQEDVAQGAINFRLRHTDGQWRHVEAVASLLDDGSQAQTLVINARDVTDRRVTDSWFRQVLETAEEGIWTLDPSGVTTFANHRMSEILGRSMEEIVGASAFACIEEQALGDLLRELDRNFTTGVRRPVETHLQRPDGSRVPVRLSTSPLRDDEGTITGGLVIVTDVSAEVDTKKELILREAWLDAIVASAFDLVVGVSEDGFITFATPSTLEILGLDETQVVVGTHLTVFVHPEDLEETVAAFGRALAGSNPRDPYECRIRRADGTYMWFEFTATNLVGEIDAVIVHGRDVTERVEASAQLERNEAWLEAILHQAFDVVVAIDAHGAVTFATPGIETFLARPLASVIGTRLMDVVHPEDRAMTSAAITLAMTEPGASESVELRVIRPGGSFIWIEALVTNLLLDPAVERIIINARDITDRHLAEAKIAYHAMHDALTGLPNRYLLDDRLGHAMARREQLDSKLAVAFIDLDHFKFLNDSSGHSVGDSALREVASRLRRACRTGDTVARFGGDEFVLISESVNSLGEAREVGERLLREVFDEPFEVSKGTIHLSASIGVALGEAGVSPDRLMADADTAMYRAKTNGRSRVEVFEPAMREEATSHLETVEALRRAVDDGDLVVQYQPIVSLSDHSIVGAEALVRLQHPVLGLIGPTDFIPLAEATGLIDSIGTRIFELACFELSRCLAIAPDMRFSMSVNVSPVQLRSVRILELPKIARRNGVDPGSIILEITESSLLGEDELMPEAIAELRAHGFRIAVDDFGTGYSSLSHLKRLAVDVVKIDQLFTAGVGTSAEDTAIVEAILAMAKALDLTVVAEGVERAEQATALAERDCAQAQGYLFSRPLPAAELESVISHQFLLV
jgi:diguanylate cyclase (GGDEF)-like protein/PAS domain S-box-containing protein